MLWDDIIQVISHRKIARERFKIKIYMLSVDIYIYLYINIYKTKNLWCKVFLRKSSEWRRMKFDTVEVYWKRNAVSEEKKRLIIVGFQSVSFVIVWMYFCNSVLYLYTHFSHLLPRFYFYNFFLFSCHSWLTVSPFRSFSIMSVPIYCV